MEKVIADCRAKILSLQNATATSIRPEQLNQIINSFKKQNPRKTISLAEDNTFLITGKKNNLRQSISIQEIPILSILAENVRALEIYQQTLDLIASDMDIKRVDSVFFGCMPGKQWETLYPELAQRFVESVNKVLTDPQDREYLLRFVRDPDWSGMSQPNGKVGRKLNRPNDWQESAILKTGGMVAAASAGRINLIRAIASTGLTEADFQRASNPASTTINETFSTAIRGRNIIFYGAPGTGKSHSVDGLIKGSPYTRTVFHPDTQNSDFFGALKPAMSGGNVTYTFQPGPLARALAGAAAHPEQHHYLVVEELNRAPAAAVFGELFQLLDRDENGTGTYEVDFPTPESTEWFKANGYVPDRLKLPRNLSILATMNSADQGVYPLDTAFRRRWEQIYLPLYDTATGYPEGTIPYVGKVGINEIRWISFVRVLNDFLQDHFDFPEDRLLGSWFVKSHELTNNVIPTKVILYLVDDLLRHEDKSKLFAAGLKNYGSIARAMYDGAIIFSLPFIDKLDAEAVKNAVATSEVAQDEI